MNKKSHASITWVLGNGYPESRESDLRRHIRSLFRFTYRRDFIMLHPYNITSDTGWGCMLRSAQMLIGYVFRRHYLGKEWRLPCDSEGNVLLHKIRANKIYCDIIKWFTDYPGVEHYYSIHHLIQCGMRYDMLPGEWFGPNTAALVLKDMATLQRSRYGGTIEVIVPNSNVIYISEIEKKVCQNDVHIDATTLQSADSNPSVTGSSYDPLYNIPEVVERPWECAVLLCIPLMLGITSITPIYFTEILDLFQSKYFVGLLGGRPGHANYFFGCHESNLYGLDPHLTFSNPGFGEIFPTDDHLQQIHTNVYEVLSIDKLDPSVVMSFYFRDRMEFSEFYNDYKKRQSTRNKLYTIEQYAPSYADDSFAAGSEFAEADAPNDDDDYVLV